MIPTTFQPGNKYSVSVVAAVPVMGTSSPGAGRGGRSMPVPQAVGEEVHAVLLWADMLRFRVSAERLRDAELATFLGDFYLRAGDLVHRHEGWVDKFMGDGMLATFGAQRRNSEPVPAALRAALSLEAEFPAFMAPWRKWQPALKEMSLRMVLHAGKCFSGHLGGTVFPTHTVIGKNVNESAVLHRAAPDPGLYATREFLDLAKGALGKTRAVEVPGGKGKKNSGLYLIRAAG